MAERLPGPLWDDYLTYHYTGRAFQDNAGSLSIPDRTETIVAPGLGAIGLSALGVSADTVSPGETILMSADVDGENIGYIYLFAGFYDREANSVNVIDMDYIDSGDTREIDGLFYPDWGEGRSRWSSSEADRLRYRRWAGAVVACAAAELRPRKTPSALWTAFTFATLANVASPGRCSAMRRCNRSSSIATPEDAHAGDLSGAPWQRPWQATPSPFWSWYGRARTASW
jgi:hypothetical protein